MSLAQFSTKYDSPPAPVTPAVLVCTNEKLIRNGATELTDGELPRSSCASLLRGEMTPPPLSSVAIWLSSIHSSAVP
jgi:hypothetical protein